jgi:hypothetical protein
MGTGTLKDPYPREDVRLMNMMRKVAWAFAAAVLSAGALGITAPAHAVDTNWPCAGCLKAQQ